MRKTDSLDVVVRKLAPYMFLFGLYLVSYGDVSPGGGFQGGVVIASGVILLAMGRDIDAAEGVAPRRRMAWLEGVCYTLLLVAVVGMVIARSMFVLNMLIGLKVAAGVSLISLHLFGER